MIDKNTFLTTLYVMIDDFCKAELPPEATRPGRNPSLSRSEEITLAIFGQWYLFRSQRDFYRQNAQYLRAALPSLPTRPQLNRLIRAQQEMITNFFLCLVKQLDTTGVPVRNVKRGEEVGWPARRTSVGVSAWGGSTDFVC